MNLLLFTPRGSQPVESFQDKAVNTLSKILLTDYIVLPKGHIANEVTGALH
jgi:hypothetical protein